jgi:hypothetical protein
MNSRCSNVSASASEAVAPSSFAAAQQAAKRNDLGPAEAAAAATEVDEVRGIVSAE